MSERTENTAVKIPAVQIEKVFQRFSVSQRWEHWILLLSFTTLLLTGLPQKYRTSTWSQQLIATPDQLALIQTIHHIAAIALILEVLYHLGKTIYRMARRSMPDDMFVSWQDFRDAGQMVAYLLFLRKDRPAYGKYSFEEKVTYWFIFLGVGIMLVSGLILWFPEFVTRFLPGGVIPAAMLAHSTEAMVAGIFIVIWHFFHVHLQRLNLSIFNGKINEKDMQTYHALEYGRLMEAKPGKLDETGGEQS
jgi:formate dehydrogenase gamma subunit